MSYFLGFVIDREPKKKIKDVVRSIKGTFDDLGIPVRWSKPSTYHITLFYLGENYSILNRAILKKRLSQIDLREIGIQFGSVRVGISRNYKELIYLDVKEGGEQLRDLLLEVRKQLVQKDVSMFVPHLTLGRISKDLSSQEYRNVVRDISNMSRKINIQDISLTIQQMYLIQSVNGVYSFKMEFEIS
jgi:2'-5' RNA ligase